MKAQSTCHRWILSIALALLAACGSDKPDPHARRTVTGTSGDQSATKTFTLTVSGPAGSVDTSFGGGPVITAINTSEDYARAIAVQPGGKIVVAGSTNTSQQGYDFAVARYKTAMARWTRTSTRAARSPASSGRPSARPMRSPSPPMERSWWPATAATTSPWPA